ncbi:hypothetical protein [Lysinibacter sp. HNR]|uniref:hypothetical protein n=1 Tax=Lysinibacter sp. HNR TaxID=3031408 RepID=UPI002435B50E|nr:hypothetical protein [Lysinibacter sp. HNR]WGD36444.1 hypothetical protein FrondiHNR_08120 [Lysinibacter sp. HNR]
MSPLNSTSGTTRLPPHKGSNSDPRNNSGNNSSNSNSGNTPSTRRHDCVTLLTTTLRTGIIRITLPSGEIHGYVFPKNDAIGPYFQAALHTAGTSSNRHIGDFSRYEDAVESLTRSL